MSGSPADRPLASGSRRSRLARRLIALLPRGVRRRSFARSLEARLVLSFTAVVTATLVLVSAASVNRLDAYLGEQETQIVSARAGAVANIAQIFLQRVAGSSPVVSPGNVLNSNVGEILDRGDLAAALTQTALSDVRVRIGLSTHGTDGALELVPAAGGEITGTYSGAAPQGQTRQRMSLTFLYTVQDRLTPWAMEVTLSKPYTYRITTISDLTSVVGLVALLAILIAIVLAGVVAQRLTTPIRRLTDAARVIGSGDLTARVPADLASADSVEVAALSGQFNTMAERLEQSLEMIRRDRDRSRDFLADVSHELRTPIAALRTFNELLREGAEDDPAARSEFLEASGQQIERLDWLAQNLLELSKLDSGLVLLDLRPDDIRAAVESAIEQADPVAKRRGIALELKLPSRPVRVRHDPPRIGQVLSNLVNNALKFTPRGGSVTVELEATRDGGARIRVIDTGIGIDASELPRIFDRFYRGARSAEARASGSGLGLAIVRSIVEMHEGRVAVESRLGEGTTFTVTLPHDPRTPDAGETTPSAG